MPHDPPPFEQAKELAREEALLRSELSVIARAQPETLLSRAPQLHPYWRSFYRVLLSHALVVAGRHDLADAVVRELPEAFRAQIQAHVDAHRDQADAARPVPLEAPKPEQLFETERRDHEADDVLDALEALCGEIEIEQRRDISRSEYAVLRTEFVDQVVAARSDDFPPFGRAQIEERLRNLRQPR